MHRRWIPLFKKETLMFTHSVGGDRGVSLRLRTGELDRMASISARRKIFEARARRLSRLFHFLPNYPRYRIGDIAGGAWPVVCTAEPGSSRSRRASPACSNMRERRFRDMQAAGLKCRTLKFVMTLMAAIAIPASFHGEGFAPFSWLMEWSALAGVPFASLRLSQARRLLLGIYRRRQIPPTPSSSTGCGAGRQKPRVLRNEHFDNMRPR